MQYFSFALAAPALAAHDEGLFELDGNAIDQAAAGADWQNGAEGSADQFFVGAASEDPANDTGYFTTGGSKDENDIPKWEITDNSVPDKNELLDAYAAVYQAGGDTWVYFGADRFDNDGDAQIGFWFFQNNIGIANGDFTGVHADGDVLILSEYTNGGVVDLVCAYEWDGAGGGANIADAGECDPATDGSHLNLVASGAACDTADGTYEICAVTNAAVATAPWPFTNKDGAHNFGVGQFFEGGINLSDMFGGQPPCFGTFLAETRSSQETDAQLKDFALGSLNTCVPPTIATQVDDSTADFGQQVTDTATLSGTNGPASGTVTFFICTPAQITAAGCPTGGTQVGSPVVVNTAPNPDTATSAAYTVGLTAAAAGKYCWRAVYTPDAASQYLADSHTNAGSECFTVAPATIDIEKTANPVGPVSAGAEIGFDITVTNSGTNTTLGISVSDPLPAGIVWTAGTPTGSITGLSCSIDTAPSPDVLNCTKPSLAAGASFTVHISGTTDAADCGTVSNTATVATTNDGSDSDTASVVVQCPDVTVEKTPDAGSVNAGDTATFTILVTNLGPGSATSVTLTDNLPAGYVWTLGGADAASCSINTVPSPDVLSCNFGTLADDATRTITLSAPTSGANCAVIPNTATVAATNEATAQQGNNSNSGAIDVLCANVGIVKTANPVGPVSAGSDIGFDITVTNNGDGTATNVSVSDPLPAGIVWTVDAPTGSTAGVSCAIDTVPSPDVLTCTDASMPAGASFTVHIHGTTDSADCGTVSNTATVSTGNDGGGSSTASVVVQCPDIKVTKAPDGATVDAGGTITWSIKVENLGPGAATGVVLTDNLPAGIDWTEAEADCSITGAVNSEVLSCTVGSLASGASKTYQVSGVTDKADCGPITNTASATATNEPSNVLANNSDNGSVTVLCATVTIGKTADAATVSAGSDIGFSLTWGNSTGGAATDVVVTDNLPGTAGLHWTIAGSTGTGSTCAITGADGSQVLTCAVGTIPGNTAVSGTVHVVSDTTSASCAVVNNTGTITSGNDGSAEASASVTVLCPDISVVKTADDGTISAGDVAAFTIVVTNHGLGNAVNVHVADTLPAGVAWELDPAVEGCAIVGTALTCDFATLLPGQAVELHISGGTVAANCGILHNEVVVSAANEPSGVLSDNESSADIQVDCPDILLTKTADDASINAGDPIGFTIEVSNNGAGNATGVHVTDNLPAGINWAADATTGTASATCAIAAGVLTCDAALMGPGTSFSVHIHGTTSAANCGQVDNTAVVTTTNDGGDDDDASVMVSCPDVTVEKTPDSGIVNAGENAVFTIVVSNSNAEGTGTAYDVTLTDNLPAGYVWTVGGADGEDCDIDTAPSPDVLSCDFGDLEAGATRTITLTAPTSGDNCAAIPNTANVAASNEAEAQQGNNSDDAAIDVTCPDIQVVKDATNTPIQVGQDLVFEITTSNIGDGVADDVVLTDTLPAGFDWAVDNEDCAIAAGVLTCDFGDMAPDASITITLTAPTSGDPETGNIDCAEDLSHTIPNLASATAGNEGEDVLDNNEDDATIVVNCSALVIDKSFTGNTAGTDPDLDVPAANIGDTLAYTLHYTGAGSITNAVITDVLPDGLDFVEGSPCTVPAAALPCATDDPHFAFVGYDDATRTLTWTAATLPNPTDGEVTYDVIVLVIAPEFAQPLVNVATIDSDQTPPDSDTSPVTVLAPPLELTPPPTSTLTPQSGTSNPGFALMLILIGVAGLTLGIGFITPVPARVRRRERLG